METGGERQTSSDSLAPPRLLPTCPPHILVLPQKKFDHAGTLVNPGISFLCRRQRLWSDQ